jgi:hypothetical protein
LVFELGVRIVVILWRFYVLLEHWALGEGNLTMVGVVGSNDLDVVEADVGLGC